MLTDSLRRAARESGMTQEAMAEYANTSQPSISRFLSGRRGLRSSTMDKLADALPETTIKIGRNTSRPSKGQ